MASTSTNGESILAELRDRSSATELRALLSRFALEEDAATLTLRERVGATLDLGDLEHRRALLRWLRSWGCRHLRVADDARSSAALLRWWRGWSDALPGSRRSLVDLSRRELERIEPAYAALASLPAAFRAAARGDVAVTFGDTAAAKALFAIRPRAFPPWDEPIRRAFGTARGDGALYRAYLEATAGALRGASARLGVPLDELAAHLGRPSSTAARLVDEYLWLRVTRDARGGAGAIVAPT